MDRWGEGLFKEAYSFIPQSTVADKINREGLLFIHNNEEFFKELELLLQVHDSINFQIPLSTPWEKHAEMLLKIKASLETPVRWKASSFIIPADVEMGLNFNKYDKEKNPQGLREVKINEGETVHGLAGRLHDIYGELRATGAIQTMDRNLSHSSMPPT
jgi:hypothetical protein